MEKVIINVVPLLGASDNVIHRQGAIEAIACILNYHAVRLIRLMRLEQLLKWITVNAVLLYCNVTLFSVMCCCVSSVLEEFDRERHGYF